MPDVSYKNETKRITTYLANFRNIKTGEKSKVEQIEIDGIIIPRFTNEFWTAKQRQANSIHEITYRASFKPELPRFFIELLSNPRDIVYDPFSGRGTTVLEATLLGRKIISNDLHPLSSIFCKPRFFIPDM